MAKRMKNKGLLNHLKRWGLKVDAQPGWRKRGRPYDFYPRAIMVHHDASSTASGNLGALKIVTNGRAGLPGPLSQFVLARDGQVVVVAAGYANHAGLGAHKSVPANRGNTYAIGIEAANNGVGEKWSKAQLNAYYRLCAALMVWIGTKDVDVVLGHKEWTRRKIDPAGINMNNFRNNVQKALDQGPTVKTVKLSRLKYGKRNADVLLVKNRLRKKGLYDGPGGKFFGKSTRRAYAAWQAKLGYTGSDADGIPGKASLRKLGFHVVD